MVDSDGEHADHVARTGSDDRGSKDPSRTAFDIDDSSPAFARGLSRSLANFERNAQLPPDIEGDERITQIWCVGSSLIGSGRCHRSKRCS